MGINRFIRRHYWVKAVAISLLAFILSWFVAYDFTSLSFFAPLEKASDFIASDFYAMVADSRVVKKYDSRISVVSIDNLSRYEIAEVLDTLASYDPQVIACDVIFQERGDDTDVALAESMSKFRKIIRPEIDYTEGEDNSKDSRMAGTSVYDMLSNAIPGVVNLEVPSIRSVVREFRNDGFAAKAVENFDEEAYKELIQRNHQKESINYSSSEFDVLSAQEALENPALIKDRLVFVGVTEDFSDMYATPVSESTPGILIHAASASTILSSEYIDKVPDWIEYLLAMLLCFSIVYAQHNVSATKVGNIIVRWLQVGFLVMLVVVGTMIYLHFNVSLDLTIPLLMVTLGLLAADLWDFASAIPFIVIMRKFRVCFIKN